MPMPRKAPVTDNAIKKRIVRAYVNGESVLALALKHGTIRTEINRILDESGVIRRTQSEQELIKWSRMSLSDREAQFRAAHEAARGRIVKNTTKIKQASLKELKGSCESNNEIVLLEMLRQRGLSPVPQKRIGIYNCDFTIDTVAVEIRGSHHDFLRTPRFRKRLDHILNSGYSVVIVCVSRKKPLTPEIADYVASFVKVTSRHKSSRREYRVIWGTPERISRGCDKFNETALMNPFTHGKDSMTGRYKSIPR